MAVWPKKIGKRRFALSCLAMLFGLALWGGSSIPVLNSARAEGAGDVKRVSVVDIHTHLSPRTIGFALEVMKENGLGLMINLSGGSSERGFRIMEKVRNASGGRILSFFNPSWSNIDSPAWGYTQAQQLRVAVEDYGFRGLKISKALGLSVRLEGGVLLPVDDAALDPLWEMAGLLGVPVAIHTADPRAFWQETNEANERYDELSLHPSWSYYERFKSGDVPSWEELLEATAEVIRRHPETNFIGVHFGNAPERLDLVERWLESFPNFYVDISARVGEIGRHQAEKVRALFLRFQDKILFGTDIGITPYGLMLGAPGKDPSRPEHIKPFYDLHWRWLETADTPMPHPVPIQGNWPVHGISLPDSVLEKIYRTNALRLLSLPTDQP